MLTLTGPPSLAKAHEKLVSEECARVLAGVGGVGVTESIEKALDIEQMQYVLFHTHWQISIISRQARVEISLEIFS